MIYLLEEKKLKLNLKLHNNRSNLFFIIKYLFI
jgi:hypothetical protein